MGLLKSLSMLVVYFIVGYQVTERAMHFVPKPPPELKEEFEEASISRKLFALIAVILIDLITGVIVVRGVVWTLRRLYQAFRQPAV